ncbi:MAG: hypothetical protein JWN34_1326 [Bryobacterales bacterium]|nr:hypothetical protein [Bryobacterales bacterium]
MRARRSSSTACRQSELHRTVKQTDRRLTVIQADASSISDIETLYPAVKAQKGRIDTRVKAESRVSLSGPDVRVSRGMTEDQVDQFVRASTPNIRRAGPAPPVKFAKAVLFRPRRQQLRQPS